MFWIILAFSAILGGAHAQFTAESNIAPDLRECYTNPYLLDRNNLPPATIQVLIDVIQKIEDNQNVDLRVLAVLLLHTFRQDGIEFHQPEAILGQSSVVLPFAPTFHSFYRHRLLLTKLIPSSLQTLDNSTVSATLKCALHHMLSTTVDARVRGDENSCGQLSQYRALRTARSVDDNVEVFTPPRKNVRRISKSERQLLGDSTCPILTGVVHTRWGAVSAGNLIAGIAAGAQSQQVTLTELTRGLTNAFTNTQQTVSNLYPATLSGDLAEAVLVQGTRGVSTISIGTSGNWNSTQAPRFFMLSNRQNVEMTDPEIRGGMDGFILGSRMTSVLQTFSTLKLSQLLDMYYSPRNGVFDSTVRACNRPTLSQTIINDNNLLTQTTTFTNGLNAHIPLQGTLVNGIDTLVSNAVTNFQSYSQSNLNDLNCDISESGINYRLATNFYIVLDTTWQYQYVYPAISYLLDSIEVNKYGSSVTLLNAFDGSVVVNKTFSLSDFHTQYTLARHQALMTGVNLDTTYTRLREMMQASLLEETVHGYVGGNSTVLLFLINSGNLQITQTVQEQARIINETVPDLRVLYATSTNQFDNLWGLVRDMHSDIHTISLTSTGTNMENVMAAVLNRIRQVGRRIINPLCGYQYTDGSSGTKTFDDYVEPGYINFYSVNPNYFYENNDNRRVRVIRSGGSGSLTVCHSRVVPQPRRNSTVAGLDENMITCQDLTGSATVELSLQNACDGYSTIGSCPLFYMSVESTASTVSSSAVCTSNHVCRFPYNIRYQVQIEELACFSNGTGILPSVVFIIAALLFNMFRSLQ